MIEKKGILRYNDIGHEHGIQLEKETNRDYKFKPYRLEGGKKFSGNTLVLRNERFNNSLSDRE